MTISKYHRKLGLDEPSYYLLWIWAGLLQACQSTYMLGADSTACQSYDKSAMPGGQRTKVFSLFFFNFGKESCQIQIVEDNLLLANAKFNANAWKQNMIKKTYILVVSIEPAWVKRLMPTSNMHAWPRIKFLSTQSTVPHPCTPTYIHQRRQCQGWSTSKSETNPFRVF